MLQTFTPDNSAVYFVYKMKHSNEIRYSVIIVKLVILIIVEFDSLDGGDDGECSAVGFVEISKISATQGAVFHKTESH